MEQRQENNSPEAHEAKLIELNRAFATALLMGDEVGAEEAIRDAMDAGLSTAEIDDRVIAPAMWLIGDLWERGEISVADEHVATEISTRVLALQREAERLAVARGGHKVMLATPQGELHVVALRMVANLLREAGYDVLMLGSDVPPADLAGLAARYEPDVVCLSTTMPGGADRVLVTIDEIQAVRPEAGFVIGGRGLRSRMRSEPGIDVCTRVPEVVEAVDAIIKRADLN
jgi:MerR family transcriptional regulator, light-induced transcriptional regulator